MKLIILTIVILFIILTLKTNEYAESFLIKRGQNKRQISNYKKIIKKLNI